MCFYLAKKNWVPNKILVWVQAHHTSQPNQRQGLHHMSHGIQIHHAPHQPTQHHMSHGVQADHIPPQPNLHHRNLR